MNSLEIGTIKKSGYANGWELCLSESNESVRLASARHPEQTEIQKQATANAWTIALASNRISNELARSYPRSQAGPNRFQCDSEPQLGHLLRRAAELAHSLPNQAAANYHARLATELERIKDTGTEAERIVKQRIGQNAFREALTDYWGGACAVIGISVPEVLRASHAKPWSHCEIEEERLNVYNGFLLSANLDALFDKGLITFEDTGAIRISPTLSLESRSKLSLSTSIQLRWIDEKHIPFLRYHRSNIFKPNPTS